MACHVKAHLDEVGREIARVATEAHGGMGFTDLSGLRCWRKRIGHDCRILGRPERRREDAAILQGWPANRHRRSDNARALPGRRTIAAEGRDARRRLGLGLPPVSGYRSEPVMNIS